MQKYFFVLFSHDAILKGKKHRVVPLAFKMFWPEGMLLKDVCHVLETTQNLAQHFKPSKIIAYVNLNQFSQWVQT